MEITQEKFEEFLNNWRKSNGDLLTEQTKQKYLQYYVSYKNFLESCPTHEELFAHFSALLIQKQSLILKNFLTKVVQCLGFESIKDWEALINKKLPKIKKHSTAMSSQRYLQSKVLTKMQFEKMVEACETLKEKLILLIMYDTAARRGEIQRLRHCDIQLFIGDEYIDMKKSGLWAEVRLHGKGDKKRTVYLRKETVIAYLQLFKDDINTTTQVFTFKVKGKLVKHPDNVIYKLIHRLGMKALDMHVHPHMIRHTVGQHMADDDVNFKHISSYFGHTTTAPTEIYVKNSKVMNLKAAQKQFGSSD